MRGSLKAAAVVTAESARSVVVPPKRFPLNAEPGDSGKLANESRVQSASTTESERRTLVVSDGAMTPSDVNVRARATRSITRSGEVNDSAK